MGIKWFESFLKRDPKHLLQPCELHEQYIVIDGSELLFELYFDGDPIGRGDYASFHQKVVTFVNNLRECGITPVVMFDRFKYSIKRERFIERKEEKIEEMFDMFTESKKGKVKPSLCELTLQQTLEQLNVAWSYGSVDADQEQAMLANQLKAPVLASDTVFAAFNLANGWLPFRWFKWHTDGEESDVKKGIEAKIFRQRNFAKQFGIDGRSMPYLAVVFSNVTMFKFEDFKNFRERILKPMSNANLIESMLKWIETNYDNDIATIDEIVDARVEDPSEMKAKILKFLEICRNPRCKRSVLRKICGNMDPEKKFPFDLDSIDDERFIEEDEPESSDDPAESHWRFSNALPRLVGDDQINYLPMILTDPRQFGSPNEVSKSLRSRIYQAMVGHTQNRKVVEYDRSERRYTQTFEYNADEPESDLGRSGNTYDSNADVEVMQARRDYILGSLYLENERFWAAYDKASDNLDPGIRLTVAASFYWITKATPERSAIEALAFQIAVCQTVKNLDEILRVQQQIERRLPRQRGLIRDARSLHWSSQWQVCLRDAIALNQTLGYPFDEPVIGRVCQGSLFESACDFSLAKNDLKSVLDGQQAKDMYRQLGGLLIFDL